MKKIITTIFLTGFSSVIVLHAQKIKLSPATLDPVQVSLSYTSTTGYKAVQVIKDSSVKEADEPTFARVKDIGFHNGTIEVKLLSRLLKTAKPSDRGFIGLAFRINEDNTKFECVYLRPTNGRAEDQVRRNHSIQYFSYPGYKFDHLRKTEPEKYESYADMALNEWISVKLVVHDSQVKLYLNNNQQPSLVVNDMKNGASASGGIGLYVDMGTEGYYRDLKISKEE